MRRPTRSSRPLLVFILSIVASDGNASAGAPNLTRALRRERRKRIAAEEALEEAERFYLHERRSEWQPRRALPCNTTRHLDRPRVSVLIQSFADGANAPQLAQRLHELPIPGGVEVLVNDDSGRDHDAWRRALRGANDGVLSLPNVHEIRAYNRMARMARGDFLVLLQGDHCLPRRGEWLARALALFERFPTLGLLGGQMGFDQVPTRKIAENISWGMAPCKPIPTRVGGFDEAYSCAGEPGIQLDTEISLQLWQHGYSVGLWYAAVSNGVGGRKTRKNRAQKRFRLQNDALNAQRCERVMRQHDAAAVAAANAALEPIPQADSARGATEAELGMRAANACA